MTNHTIKAAGRSKMGSVLLHEFREMLPPTIFFFVGFNLILLPNASFWLTN